jgi:hypothetical protein
MYKNRSKIVTKTFFPSGKEPLEGFVKGCPLDIPGKVLNLEYFSFSVVASSVAVADSDLGSGAFFTLDPGSGIKNSDSIFEYQFFG